MANTHHHRHGTQGGGTEDVLRRAEEVCGARGLRLTDMRRRVLSSLARSRQPLGAYELADAMREDGRISPVSIYRTLEFLEDAGLVHRLSIRPAYVVCSHEHPFGEATVFLLCRACGGVDEVTSGEIESDLASVTAQTGFSPERRAVEIEGRCRDCAAAG